MSGDPLVLALRAAKAVVQNLRREDNFSLITLDDAAEVVIPMGPVSSKQAVLDRIDRIQTGGSTDLTGGWMLGRDDLRGTPAGIVRRQLLLTDGSASTFWVSSTPSESLSHKWRKRENSKKSNIR